MAIGGADTVRSTLTVYSFPPIYNFDVIDSLGRSVIFPRNGNVPRSSEKGPSRN